MLMIGGLWLYSRCCMVVHAQQYNEYLDEVELRYSDMSDSVESEAPAMNSPL